jgi:hypothetical protein
MKKDYRLPRVFTEKWLAALESGGYAQGKAFLYDGNRENYCCLGVACIVAGASQEELHGVELPDSLYNIPQLLPHELVNGPLVDELSRLNDGRYKSAAYPEGRPRHTFPEIAAWIRENVELY